MKKTKKQKKRESKMYENMNRIGFQVSNVAQKKIVDVKSDKHFGVLMTTQRQIEDFQIKSGMTGAFKNEYQYHYWALVARVEFEDEILDIAIPTAIFNYKQYISGAAVDFHLTDVEEASAKAKEVAEKKVEEIINGYIGSAFMEEMPIIQWIHTPLNTCHVHPGSLATFSGTDYAKTINDPGVCFPLDEPNRQASFSSILCHGADNVAKMVRTEYRFANFEDGNNKYYHGSCLQYVKGYSTEYKEEFSPIKAMFYGEPKVIKKEVPDYHFKDRIPVDLAGSFIEKFVEIFNKSGYEPDTSMILKENIQKKPIISTVRTGYNAFSGVGNNKHSIANKTTNINSTAYDIEEMRDALMEDGYTASNVFSWGFDTLKKFYDRLMEEKEKKSSVMTRDAQSLFDDIAEMNDYNMSFNEAEDGTVFVSSVIEWKESPEARKFVMNHMGYTEGMIDMMTEEEFEEILEKLNY